jgi:putative ABC transport system permease protein
VNLAVRDIRHNFGRFILTAMGIGLLLMTVMGMTGIYRGLVEDATGLVDRIGADLWAVQRDTRGPFSEVSNVPRTLEDRVKGVPGVARSRAFFSHIIQRERRGQPLRMMVQGLSWPQDDGQWLPIMRGRPLAAPHYEMIADKLLGLPLGERVAIGKDVYTVVGITRGMIGTGGDGMAFFSLADAQFIQRDSPGEAIRLDRASQRKKAGSLDIGRTQPALLDKGASVFGAKGAPISAVLVDVTPGMSPAQVQGAMAAWGDVTVYTSADERELLLKGNVDKSRRQLWLFRVILVITSSIIMALIVYTMTLDKVHDIALLKLMGARNSVILGMIMQQAVVLGALGYIFGYYVGQFAFPYFPRRVSLAPIDLLAIAGVVLGISVLSSLLGIWRTSKIDPNMVLS